MASASQAEGEREDGRELATRQIVCENKRIHIDLCRNDRGEFFKLSEIDQTGKRSKVFFPVSGARTMADTFDEFAECDEGYGDTAPAPVLDAEGYPQPLKSTVVTVENKRFFCDLRANDRGRFLKLAQMNKSATGNSRNSRVTIVIPTSGLRKLSASINETCAEAGIDMNGVAAPALRSAPHQEVIAPEHLPSSKTFSTSSKKFFFDMFSNDRGVYLRVTELGVGSQRNSIAIPQEAWPNFAQVLQEYSQIMP